MPSWHALGAPAERVRQGTVPRVPTVHDGVSRRWPLLAGLVPEAEAAPRHAADFMQRP